MYDTGKPVSRVRQLEDKVAELEAMLTGSAGSRRASNEDEQEKQQQQERQQSYPYQAFPATSASAGNTASAQNPVGGSSTGFSFAGDAGTNEAFDFNALDDMMVGDTGNNGGIDPHTFYAFGASMVGKVNVPQQPQSFTQGGMGSTPAPPVAFDFSTLDPNFMSLLNSFDNTFQSPQQVGTNGVSSGAGRSQSISTGMTAPSTSQSFSNTYPPFNTSSMQSIPASTGYSSGNGLTGFSASVVPTNAVNQASIPLPAAGILPQATSQQTQVPAYQNGGSLPYPLKSNSQSFSSNSSTSFQPSPQPQSQPQPPIGISQRSSFQAFVSDNDGVGQSWSNDGQNQTSSAFIQSANSAGNSSYASPEASNGPSDRIAFDSVLDQTIGVKSSDAAVAGLAEPRSQSSGLEGLDTGGYELVGGWFDANDLPKIARDHL